jgi:hypothetical protein
VITATDDGLVRTHDEMRELLTYAVPGARVTVEPIVLAGTTAAMERSRRWRLAVDRIGREPLETVSIYALPCRAQDIAATARRYADEALAR